MVRARVRSAGRAAVLAVAVVAVSLLALVASASAADKVVVTLGANLSAAQQQEMLDLFKVKRGSVPIIEVTNQEERRYLQDFIPLAKIGTRAISSAYVRLKSDGSGIKVQTKNINYVTEQTYANALVTAGVKDADVYAAAPFAVSGTAALTGVFKAFEQATGTPISEQAKRTATQELVDTAQTGQEVGNQNKVAELMRRAKEKVVSQGLKDPAAIEQVVVNISNQLNLTLTQTQINRLTQVLVQIGQLNINVGTLQQQLKDFQTKIGLTNEQAQGIVQSIKSFFSNLWRSVFGG